MDSRTDAVTNASDDLTEAISNPHGHENSIGADADLGEVADFYYPYDPMETNTDPEDFFSTSNQIEGIAYWETFGNGDQKHLSVPLHPAAEPPESAECTIADAISSNPHPKSNLQWAPVAGNLQSAEHVTADPHATFNNPHHTDGNPDVNAMPSDAHQYHPSLPLDPIDEALMINAGDASQTSHNRSRTQALLTQTHAERPSSNTQLTYPIGTLSSGGSPYIGGMDRPHTGNPGHKRRRTGDRESSNTDLAGRLPSSTIPTNRTSTSTNRTSTSTNRTSTSTNRTSTSSTSVAPPPTDKELAFCPMCNMGDGKSEGLNNGTSAGTPGSIGQSTLKWKPNEPHFVVTKPTTAPTTFKKHMTMVHKKLFSGTSFSDFFCGYCACAYTPACATKFHDWEVLLEHLWEFHKHASSNPAWHFHYCGLVCASTSSNP